MHRQPELAKKKESCCGCGICSLICPMAAITMREDDEGFNYPKIDQFKCVRCGKCERTCIYILKR